MIMILALKLICVLVVVLLGFWVAGFRPGSKK